MARRRLTQTQQLSSADMRQNMRWWEMGASFGQNTIQMSWREMLLPDEIVTVIRDRRIKQMHLNISYLGYLQSPCTIFVCARLLFYQPKISWEIRGGMQNNFLWVIVSVIFRCLIWYAFCLPYLMYMWKYFIHTQILILTVNRIIAGYLDHFIRKCPH